MVLVFTEARRPDSEGQALVTLVHVSHYLLNHYFTIRVIHWYTMHQSDL